MKWLEPAFSQRPSVLDHIVHQMVFPRAPHSIPKIQPTKGTHTHTYAQLLRMLLVIVPANLGGKGAEKGGTMIWQKFGNTNTKSSNVTVAAMTSPFSACCVCSSMPETWMFLSRAHRSLNDASRRMRIWLTGVGKTGRRRRYCLVSNNS